MSSVLGKATPKPRTLSLLRQEVSLRFYRDKLLATPREEEGDQQVALLRKMRRITLSSKESFPRLLILCFFFPYFFLHYAYRLALTMFFEPLVCLLLACELTNDASQTAR